jgi:hypothetical protein
MAWSGIIFFVSADTSRDFSDVPDTMVAHFRTPTRIVKFLIGGNLFSVRVLACDWPRWYRREKKTMQGGGSSLRILKGV